MSFSSAASGGCGVVWTLNRKARLNARIWRVKENRDKEIPQARPLAEQQPRDGMENLSEYVFFVPFARYPEGVPTQTSRSWTSSGAWRKFLSGSLISEHARLCLDHS